MKRLLFVLVGAFGVASADARCQGTAGGKDTVKEEKSRLQGVWVCTKLGFDGKVLDAIDEKLVPRGITITFDGDKAVFAQGQTKIPAEAWFKYTIDPSQKPKAIDIGLAKGIYSLDGDHLKLSYFKDYGKDKKRNARPADFATKPGDGFASFEFKRKKP
jgi:uncharacterized protein (TIGR03067 family)